MTQPPPADWTTRRVGKDEELKCGRCLRRIRPGQTAYVAPRLSDSPECRVPGVYCSPACRQQAERPDLRYVHHDGGPRKDAGDGYIDLADAYAAQGHVTVLAEELPRLRERIAALRTQADDAHDDLAAVYRKDADDLAAIANACDAGRYLAATRLVDRLDTAVRDELGQRLYDAIGALAAELESRRHQGIAYSGDAVDVLKDVLRDNLSPQAVAAVVAYLQPAKTNNAEVDRQLRWLADRLTELVGGPEQQGRLADEVGL